METVKLLRIIPFELVFAQCYQEEGIKRCVQRINFDFRFFLRSIHSNCKRLSWNIKNGMRAKKDNKLTRKLQSGIFSFLIQHKMYPVYNT